MNSSSIFSSRVSRSSSRSRARSFTVSGGSSPACSRRYMPTQLPRVPSLIPSSFATRAIGRDVSITIFTASSLNSGEKLFFARGNYFTFPDVHPIGWTVRKSRGTSELLECGLLRGSYVPSAEQKEMRDLTRYRKKLVQARTSEIQ